MASSLIAKLPKKERQQLLDNLNYLNLSEIKSFCKRHSIPYRIVTETEDGRRKTAHIDDRKGLILNRIRHFLQTGLILEETRFSAAVVLTNSPTISLRTIVCITGNTIRQTAL
jgi:hypothetical protein